MNRRTFTRMLGVTGAAALLPPTLAQAQESAEADGVTIAGAIPLTIDNEITINAASTPFEVSGNKVSIIGIGRATFRLSPQHQLTATVHASVLQWSTLTYRISIAVFDEQLRLLGAASHDEDVQYVRLGVMPTVFRDIPFDFGISTKFSEARLIALAISEIDVPKDPTG